MIANTVAGAIRGEPRGEGGAEFWCVLEAGTGFDADDSDERRAWGVGERLAARQDVDVVGEDVGFGKIGDTDVGRQSVEVFRFFPGPEDALGDSIGKGCGERWQGYARDACLVPVMDARDPAEERERDAQEVPTTSGWWDAGHGALKIARVCEAGVKNVTAC